MEMEKETAMKILKELHGKSLFAERTALETIIPELKESEDERVKKRILLSLEKDLMATKNSGCDTQNLEQCIAWLEKQGESYTKKDIDDAYLKGICDAKNELEKQCEQKQFYIRFGDIPEGEKSSVWRGDEFLGKENGVSVYPAFKHNGNIVLGLSLPITKTTLHTQQHLLEYDNRPCYLVKGDYIGNGADGEPLIRNVEIVEEIKDFRVKEGEARYEVKAVGSLSVNGKTFDYEKATITQKDFASVGETATIELSSPIDCGDRIYHVSHKPIEKQGEQKPAVTDFNAKDWYVSKVDGKIHDMTYNPADKVEPKFHKGEWIVWKNKCYKVNYNGCGYELIDQNGLSTWLEYGTVDENAHLWE